MMKLSALYDITFGYEETDDRALEALNQVEEMLSGYDIYVSTGMGDASAEQIASEMQVTIVLQLALSIDYAVIFCNRYKEEHQNLSIREADIVALSKAIPEISSSSLTTIGGLIAMMFMKFGIGSDMALCLIRAILLSLLAVFLLMPGLIMLFGGAMEYR